MLERLQWTWSDDTITIRLRYTYQSDAWTTNGYILSSAAILLGETDNNGIVLYQEVANDQIAILGFDDQFLLEAI